MGDQPLSDTLLFDALECGLRLSYEEKMLGMDYLNRDQERISPETAGELKSALYRKLLALFTMAKEIQEQEPESFSKWIKGSDPGAFFDLPLRTESFRTTLPLLYRDHSGQLYLAQFQGRRWSKKEHTLRPIDLLHPKINRYIQRITFRYAMFCAQFQDVPPPIPVLIFPNSAYRKEPYHRLEEIFERYASPDIFVSIGVQEWVLEEIGNTDWLIHHKHQIKPGHFEPGKHCFACRFRKKIPGKETGCWENQVDTKEIRNPHLHIPDLPGHGNLGLIEEGILFQELAGEKMTEPQTHLTLQWRRAKQVEIAVNLPSAEREREVIHPGLRDRIKELQFPLHFLDFEAASFPVSPGFPSKPYIPVLFQFSCHSIDTPEDLQKGLVRHHHWVDREMSEDPEIRLLKELFTIDKLHSGTIFHYAPFERQHLMKLNVRSKQVSSPEWSSIREPLGDFIHSTSGSTRFIDMADWVSRYYYHEKLEGRLGLKDLYQALRSEGMIEAHQNSDVSFSERVKNGEHAMHIYLGLRTGILDLSSKEEWMTRLMDYCDMDTWIMAQALIYWNRKLHTNP